MSGRLLYHLASAADWERAGRLGHYDGSTVGRSLADEGFVHCSFADQVQGVADRAYRGRHDVVLLRLDPAALGHVVRVEALGGAPEPYPHVYGPIPVAAVLDARTVPAGPGGVLALGPLPDRVT